MAAGVKSTTASKEVANALLANLLQGKFPDEGVSQAELTAEGIPEIVEGLEKAVGGVKVCGWLFSPPFSIRCGGGGDWLVGGSEAMEDANVGNIGGNPQNQSCE